MKEQLSKILWDKSISINRIVDVMGIHRHTAHRMLENPEQVSLELFIDTILRLGIEFEVKNGKFILSAKNKDLL